MLIEKDRTGVEEVRRWGNMISDAALDPEVDFFYIPEYEGFIAYKLQSNFAVVLGDPICPFQDREILVKKFHQYCRSKRWNIIYLIVSQEFKDWALGNFCKGSIQFGEELFVDPFTVKKENGKHKGRHLRYKLRRAKNEGVEAYEYTTSDPELEKEMEFVKEEWLKSRRGFQLYISPIQLFTNRYGKRWFYATHQGKIIAVLLLNQLQSRGGWIVNRYMTVANAPVGTIELLLETALEAFVEEGSHFFSFGPVEADKLGQIEGFTYISKWLAKGMFKMAHKFFNMGGRKGFWERFHPQSQNCYILFEKPRVGIKEMLALMRVLCVEFKRKH